MDLACVHHSRPRIAFTRSRSLVNIFAVIDRPSTTRTGRSAVELRKRKRAKSQITQARDEIKMHGMCYHCCVLHLLRHNRSLSRDSLRDRQTRATARYPIFKEHKTKFRNTTTSLGRNFGDRRGMGRTLCGPSHTICSSTRPKNGISNL